jgi:hypothetical protein
LSVRLVHRRVRRRLPLRGFSSRSGNGAPSTIDTDAMPNAASLVELKEQWRRDESASMSGWDFSYIRDRHVSDSPPWHYPQLARELMAEAESVLDIATGGGEVPGMRWTTLDHGGHNKHPGRAFAKTGSRRAAGVGEFTRRVLRTLDDHQFARATISACVSGLRRKYPSAPPGRGSREWVHSKVSIAGLGARKCGDLGRPHRPQRQPPAAGAANPSQDPEHPNPNAIRQQPTPRRYSACSNGLCPATG